MQALNKFMEETGCPKRVTHCREVPLFSAGKRPCNNRKLWEVVVPRLPSTAVLETMAACGSGILGRK